MKVIVRGKNVEITEAIESKIVKQLEKLEKYFIISDEVEARVLVKTYPDGQKIEVTIPTEYVILRAEDVDNDLYTAIDKVVEKIEGQIRKQKTKLSRKHATKFNMASIEDMSGEEDVLVRTKSIQPKQMDLEEAIMQMELVGHSFYVYLDNETKSVSVVYKRNDGGYGLLETE